jgi:glycine/D-amino acid oxidase-like deaminating enzyme
MTGRNRKVVVIGGGIGGLTTALALLGEVSTLTFMSRRRASAR